MNEHPIDTNTAAEFAKQQSEKQKSNQISDRDINSRRFQKYGMPAFLYTLFYTFCIYQNASGITHPFFVAGTLYFYCYCMKKSEVPMKKDAVFYVVSTMLLGISIFLTDDYRIINMNKTGIFLLMIGFLLHHYYEDEKWGIVHYLQAICQTVLGALSNLFSPYQDIAAYIKTKQNEKRDHSKMIHILIGLTISFPLLFIILALLSSADAIFDRLFTDLLQRFMWNIRVPYHFFNIIWKLFIGLLIGYSLFAFLEQKSIPQEEKNRRTGEPIIAITFTALLSAVYILFCAIQVAGLFLGSLQLPDGYTYAEYARQGFFQLLFVCLINLTLVLICLSCFKESKILKILLSIISACTFILIASSAMRMITYIRYYYLTFLRIFVLWALFVIFLLMAGVVIHIYRDKFPLFRYSMIIVTVLYIIFSYSHPDYFIAKYNLMNKEGQESAFFLNDGFQDDYYLYTLSADAAPILLDVPESFDAYYYDEYKEKIINSHCGLRTFNLSRYIAKKQL